MKRIVHNTILISLVTIALSSCATPMQKRPPVNTPSDDAGIKIAEAATSISDSMIEMAKVEKVLLPNDADNSINIPNTTALQTKASIDWVGPIEELLQRIATASHYRLRVLGQKPAVPILINTNHKEQSLAEILRNIDYQAGNRASIHVYPKTQVIELRYVKFYG